MVSSSLAATTPKNATSKSASKSDEAHEYTEARKLALKDAGVQAAYKKADDKLDDRIIEIDPSLKPYVEKRRGQSASSAQAAKPATPVKQPVAAKNTSSDGTHVVTKGETLSSIALQYKVSVASLKSANNITDERKLRAGQKLVIPQPASTLKSSAPQGTPAPAKSEPGFWDRVQNSF